MADGSNKATNPNKIKKNIIVLKEHNIAYVRIPKVANSSIKFVLAHRMLDVPEDKPIKGTTKDAYWRKAEKADLVGYQDFRKHYKDFFCFSFVRNPFDRLMACYNNKIIENPSLTGAMEEMGLTLGMPFEEFVNIVAKTPDGKSDVHLRSQAGMLARRDDSIFPQFIGYLEKMGEDWARLKDVMTERGLKPFGDLPSINVRRSDKKDDVKTFYTDELREKVFKRYERDFRLFYPDIKL